MFFRGLLLALGAIALVAGIGLLVLSVGEPGTTIASSPSVVRQAVLTAARALPPGTLLRSDDTRWAEIPINQIPPGGFGRTPGADGEILGAATRRAFQPGEVIVADQLIRPTEAGFLPAVLGPGMRAISLAVDAAESGAGLIAPADHVDVILTQTFAGSGGTSGGAGFRSAGETVLHGLRVIAVDQTTNLGKGKSGDARVAVPAETRVPKTVTLEVTARQAEILTVARQLGKLQLTLRSLNDSAIAVGSGSSTEPTWGTEVSRALRSLSGEHLAADPNQENRPAPAAVPVAVQIIRGTKSEQRCFWEKTGQAADCGSAPASAAPAKAGALSPAPTAPPA